MSAHVVRVLDLSTVQSLSALVAILLHPRRAAGMQGLSEETRAGGGMHSRPPGMPSLSRRASHDLESAAAALGKSPSTASVLPIVRSTSGVVPPAEGLTMRSHRTSSANSRSVSPADTAPWAASLNTVPLDVRLPPHGKGSRLD